MRQPGSRPLVAVIGALPPPVHGQTLSLEALLGAPQVRERFDLVHVDTSDHRGIDQVGRIDLVNLMLGVVHLARLLLTLLRHRPDAVHLDLAQYGPGLYRDAAFIIIAWATRTPISAKLAGGGLPDYVASRSNPLRRLFRAVLGRIDLMLVTSEAGAERIEAEVPGLRCRYVGGGVKARPDIERTHTDPLTIIYPTSSVRRSKGSHVVRAAIEILAVESPPLRWTVVGAARDPAEWERFELLARETGCVELTGSVGPDRIQAAYADADLMVFPTSRIEGLAQVRLEAMAAGLPVITTPAGGGDEVIRHGVDGLIVPHDDPAALASGVRRLRDDRQLLDRLGHSARARQRELFTPDSLHARAATAWAELITSERGRG